jgi:hypothetical protein
MHRVQERDTQSRLNQSTGQSEALSKVGPPNAGYPFVVQV